jgi:hypothetical protein
MNRFFSTLCVFLSFQQVVIFKRQSISTTFQEFLSRLNKFGLCRYYLTILVNAGPVRSAGSVGKWLFPAALAAMRLKGWGG